MQPYERYEKILTLIENTDFVSIETIMSHLNISRSTAVRDIISLEKQHMLLRVRGGAAGIKDSTYHETSIFFRKDVASEEKKAIALKASEFVDERATILLDSGTTTSEIAKLLTSYKSIMVATYDLYIANELSNYDNIELFVTGGKVRKNFGTLTGYFTEEMIRQIHADVFFMSVDAIDLSHGCMSYNIDEIAVKKALIRAAKKTIVVCDHTKFKAIAFMNICSFEDVDIIITGKDIDAATLEILKEQNLEVILV